MGRHKHADGKAGTWIEVKVIKGRTYVYERTRIYEAGRVRIASRYLGPGPRGKNFAGDEGTQASVMDAAELHHWARAHGQKELLLPNATRSTGPQRPARGRRVKPRAKRPRRPRR